jgi:hypothetical protein
MTATSTGDLKQACLMLRNAAPEQWDGFLRVMIDYTDRVTFAVTEADANTVLNAQGRAQQLHALLRVYHECEPKLPPAQPAPKPPPQ